MRSRHTPLEPGAEFVDGVGRYRVVRVDTSLPNPQGFDYVWAELIGR
jgi:hypothetical protein